MINFFRENWFYLLMFGAFIFMMVRGGGCCGGGRSHEDQGGGCCGNGHSHGDQDGDSASNSAQETGHHVSQSSTVIDPICGMDINPDTAIREISNGQAYFFCSESCRNEFLKRQQEHNIRSY